MINDNDIDQIEQEFAVYMSEQEKIGQVAGKDNPFYAMGKDKTRLSKLKKYSGMLQYHASTGHEKAIQVKNSIDEHLSQYDVSVSMQRQVKPLTMNQYYQNTNQFHNPFAR